MIYDMFVDNRVIRMRMEFIMTQQEAGMTKKVHIVNNVNEDIVLIIN